MSDTMRVHHTYHGPLVTYFVVLVILSIPLALIPVLTGVWSLLGSVIPVVQ